MRVLRLIVMVGIAGGAIVWAVLAYREASKVFQPFERRQISHDEFVACYNDKSITQYPFRDVSFYEIVERDRRCLLLKARMTPDGFQEFDRSRSKENVARGYGIAHVVDSDRLVPEWVRVPVWWPIKQRFGSWKMFKRSTHVLLEKEVWVRHGQFVLFVQVAEQWPVPEKKKRNR